MNNELELGHIRSLAYHYQLMGLKNPPSSYSSFSSVCECGHWRGRGSGHGVV
jgi:hypothetical protein